MRAFTMGLLAACLPASASPAIDPSPPDRAPQAASRTASRQSRAASSTGATAASAKDRQVAPVESYGYPVTGRRLQSMSGFDRKFVELLAKWAIPGGSVAVARDGKVVFARGYGWSDKDRPAAMQPDTLFRIASVSKAITAVATLRLVDEGRLKLDDKAFKILEDLKPCDPKAASVDARLYDITIRDLLQMSTGWDRLLSGDPMFAPLVHRASYWCSPNLRPDSLSIIRFWMGRRLDFDPGSRFAYSNLAYSVLEQIIQRASGMRYAQYVSTQVLRPAGIDDMRPGKTTVAAPGETRYYPFPGQEEAPSFFPNVKGLVPLPYGGDFCLEALAAPAGWIGSTVDLVRFVTRLNGDKGSVGLLKPQTFALMLSRPPMKCWQGKSEYFAMGFEVSVSADKGGLTFSRTGSFPGSMAYVAHRADGTAYAFAVNSRPLNQSAFLREAKSLIAEALSARRQWPDEDLFRR